MNWNLDNHNRRYYSIQRMAIPGNWGEVYPFWSDRHLKNPSDQVYGILSYSCYWSDDRNKRGEIEILSQLFGLPSDEIKRYLVDPENVNKKHLIAVLDYYRDIVTKIDITQSLSTPALRDDLIKWIDIIKYKTSLWANERFTMKQCATHFSIKPPKIRSYIETAWCFFSGNHILLNNHISLPDALLSITES